MTRLESTVILSAPTVVAVNVVIPTSFNVDIPVELIVLP